MNVPRPAASLAVRAVVATGDTDSHAQRLSMTAVSDTCRGRGVLDGAFAVLGALARADDGLGLTALARESGLAKTSTYRLAEQLVAIGAVQCVEHRYYVGALIGRSGSGGNPIHCCGGWRRDRCMPWPCKPARWRRCGSCTKGDSV